MNPISKDPVVELKTVGLALTMQCNFECAHCITESTPELRERISLEGALALIDVISRESKNICFTGGESFLRKHDLFECITAAKNKGLTVSVVSNGYWAKNEQTTIKNLNMLAAAGASGICISLDRFHLDFVDSKNALRIAQLSKDAGLNHLIRVCATQNDSFADSMIDSHKQDGINFQRVRVLRMGRAKFLPVESFATTSELPEGCCTTVRSPIVLPNGLVQACCGPGVEFEQANPLNLGNWKKESLAIILRRARTSPLVMALHNQGPKFVAKLVGLNMTAQKTTRRGYTGICELCTDMCNSPAIVKKIDKSLQEPSMKSRLIAAQVYQQSFAYLKNNEYLDLPEM